MYALRIAEPTESTSLYCANGAAGGALFAIHRTVIEGYEGMGKASAFSEEVPLVLKMRTENEQARTAVVEAIQHENGGINCKGEPMKIR